MAETPILEVSVVVIARNEQASILECLESLAGQSYPQRLYEILVVDNASTDQTAAIVTDFQSKQANVRLVRNPVRGIAVSRNVGIEEAHHDHVAFIDADCAADAGWLSFLAEAFQVEHGRDGSVAAVGGPNVMPKNTTLFRRAVAVAVSNYWGNHGSVQGKGPDARVDVDHLPTLNVLYDRSRVRQVGGFDENQGNISEDVDMSHRLRAEGLRLIFEPRAIISHRWREDLWAWMKNMEVYGKGRTWLMKKDRRHIKPQFAAPVLLLGAFLILFAAPFAWWLALPAGIYLFLTFLVSIYACLSQRRPHYIAIVFLIYTVTHLSYGVGQIHGLFSARGSDVKG